MSDELKAKVRAAIIEAVAHGPVLATRVGNNLLRLFGPAYNEFKQAHGMLSEFVIRELKDDVQVLGAGPTVCYAPAGYKVDPQFLPGAAGALTEPSAYRALLSPRSSLRVFVDRATGAVTVTATPTTDVQEQSVEIPRLTEEALREHTFAPILPRAAPDTQEALRSAFESNRWPDLRRLLQQSGLVREYATLRKKALDEHIRASLASAGLEASTIALALRHIIASAPVLAPSPGQKPTAAGGWRPGAVTHATFASLLDYAAQNMTESDLRQFVLPICALMLERLSPRG